MQLCHPSPRLLLFPVVSRHSYCKFTTNSELESRVKIEGKSRVHSSSHLRKQKYLCSGMYSLCFICCGYLSLGRSCISQSVKSKEKAVLPCVFCPPACCTCECFPLTTSSPSLFPPNINSFPFWFRNISLGTSSYSTASFHMIFPYSTILPQKAEKPSHTG